MNTSEALDRVAYGVHVFPALWFQAGGLRGDGRLFVNTLEVADVTKVDAGLSFPSFIVDTGLFINMGGLLVSCIQATGVCRM